MDAANKTSEGVGGKADLLKSPNRKIMSGSGLNKQFGGSSVNIPVKLRVQIIKDTETTLVPSLPSSENTVRREVKRIVDYFLGNTGSYTVKGELGEGIQGRIAKAAGLFATEAPNGFEYESSVDFKRATKGSFVLVTPFVVYNNLVPEGIDVKFSNALDATGTGDPISATLNITFTRTKEAVKDTLNQTLEFSPFFITESKPSPASTLSTDLGNQSLAKDYINQVNDSILNPDGISNLPKVPGFDSAVNQITLR